MRLGGILLAFVLIILIAACDSMNYNHSTPKQAGKYPKFTIKDSIKGYLSNVRSCFDVKHYLIDLEISPEKKVIAGNVSITFLVKDNTGKIQLDLDPVYKISSITEGENKLQFDRKHTGVFVRFNEELKKGTYHTVKVAYSGTPRVAVKPPWKGGFVWKKDKNGKHWCGVACENDGAQLWLPLKAHLSDEPDSVTSAFTIPKDLFCVSNGILLDTIVKGSKKTFTWRLRYPVNPYNITFYIGDFRKFSIPYTAADSSKMTLDFYVLPYNLEKAKEHFQQAVTTMRTFEQLFGVYPWVKDGYKLVEGPYAGMEHQTAIAYGNGYKNNQYFKFDYILVHETAHEWWGNAISVADFSDAWLHEGFATYSEALFVEKMSGYDVYLDYMRWDAGSVKNKFPVIGPKDVYYWDETEDIYNKGASVLHTLRNYIGKDSVFFRIIKKFNLENRNRIVSTPDFIAIAERESGLDLQAFFGQYLYRRESPLLEYNYIGGNDGVNYLVFKLSRTVPGLRLPVTVKQNGQLFTLYAESTEKVFSLPGKENVFLNTSVSYLEVLRNHNLY